MNNLQLNENFYIKYGSTWTIDSIYLFIISPIGFIGFILNILSLIVIFKINDNSALYKYLKVYCLISIVICFLAIFTFYVYSPRYIGLYLDAFARLNKVIYLFNDDKF